MSSPCVAANVDVRDGGVAIFAERPFRDARGGDRDCCLSRSGSPPRCPSSATVDVDLATVDGDLRQEAAVEQQRGGGPYRHRL
jgi:hypothetical protein